MKICIDAGHGGHDSGATNGDFKEKDLALQIALELNTKLLPFVDTVLTRSTDIDIELDKRSVIANNNFCDLFLSIHLNAATNKQANGIETLVYKNTGEVKRLAELVQSSLISILDAKDRGIKERPELSVLKGTKMPALLVEVGFISNDAELKKLNTKEYRNNISTGISEAIRKYLRAANEMTVQKAIELLQAKKIINSPDYWLKAASVVKHLDVLLINIACELIWF